MLTFRKLGATDQEIAQFEKYGIRYTKSQKAELKRGLHVTPPSESDLLNLERRSATIIPLAYKLFLSEHNGGVPSLNIFQKDGVNYVIDKFLMVADCNIYDSIENHLSVYKNRIPKETLPIGRSPGGDLFLINANKSSSEYGNIFYWKHDLEADGDGSSYRENVVSLAEDFPSFLSQLQE